jgi:hypothetical protein
VSWGSIVDLAFLSEALGKKLADAPTHHEVRDFFLLNPIRKSVHVASSVQ